MFLNEVNTSREHLELFGIFPTLPSQIHTEEIMDQPDFQQEHNFHLKALVDLIFILDNSLNLCIMQHSIFQIALEIDVIYLNMLPDQCTSDMNSTTSLFLIQAYMLNVFFSALFFLRIYWLFLTKNPIFNNLKRLFWFYTDCLQFGSLPKKSQIYFSK